MDKTLIKQRFAKAVATYEKEAAVQRQIASHMVELMEKYLPEDVHSNVWEIGCGTGMLTRFYLNRFTPEELYLNDLCPEVKPYLEDVLSSKVTFEAGDAEGMLPPLQTSLLVSCSALQWLEEPVSFLARCQDAMTSDAFLAFSMFGEDNMKEMCMLANADKDLSETETMLIGRIGQAMGVELDKIQQISQWVIDRIIWLEEGKIIFEKA